MAVFTAAAVAGVLGVASTSFLATVSAFALNAAVGVGLSLAVAELQKTDQPQAGGVHGKMQSGGDVPRSILMGPRATAGSLVYANTWGKSGKTPNAYLTQVIALSDVPISGVTAVWVNGAPVTVETSDTSYGDWGFPVEEYSTSGGGNNMWVKFHDGTQTQADPFLVNTVSSSSRPYENTRVGRGIAYAVVTSQVKDSLFSGFPSFRFEIAGMPLYDLSKDSTAGGVGSHRRNNPATWGGDGDKLLAVQIYNLLLGIGYDGVWLYGLQNLSAARLPATDWIEQIQKCRKSVQGPFGLEQQYQTGIEITVNTELGSTIEALLKGGQGKLIETGGTYKLRVGEPGASVLTISDGDILSTEQQTFAPFTTLANSINGITATYPEPKEAWNTKPAPPIYNSDYEERDGDRRLIADLSLDVVSRNSQVQRIMKAALAEARRERRHTIVLPPWAWPLEPGDSITLNSARNSYTSKLFRIDGVADKANLDVMLDITEVDPTDYEPPAAYIPPVFSPLDPIYPPVSVIDGWEAEPWEIRDDAGAARRPAIKVKAADDLNDVLSVRIVARVKATSAVVFDSAAVAYSSPYEWVISGSWCLPATLYQVKGIEVPYSGRNVEWSEWIDVLTPDIRLGDVDLASEVLASLEILRDWIDQNVGGVATATAAALVAETEARVAAIQAQAQALVAEQQARIAAVQAQANALSAEQAERVAGAFESADRYRAMLNELGALRDAVADLDYAKFTHIEQVRNILTVSIGSAVASFTDQITVAVAATAAVVQRVTTLEAETDTLDAAIIAVDT
ncbi:phage tail protein, partial [Rhizobium sp. Root483D2]|uniref:phage tail protein n=1 Tax=Rhizobium sp. Root483D2 TaxID=1736545 RepID=UPI0009E7C98F